MEAFIFYLVIFVAFFGTFTEASWGFSGGGKKVLLKDIEVLTLYPGKMTQGRRSSPVPQLECTNSGSAPCTSFQPRVVQCYNRGSDGVDVQWECKADMDSAYRFGEIDVSCEGYDYADDPYILGGSCGLRYSVDYTKDGFNQNDHYGWNTDESYGQSKQKSSWTSGIADIIAYAAIGLMVYAFYQTCIATRREAGQDAYSTTNDDAPGHGGGQGGYGWFGGNNTGGAHARNAPPPAYGDDASCHTNRHRGGGGGGGFWTGAAAGGLLGYMFGNGGRRNYGQQYGFGGGTGGFGGGTGGFGGHRSGGFSSGGGSRSASGFGGTSRR